MISHFEVCTQCGKHGHIYYGDGDEGRDWPEVCFKLDALQMLARESLPPDVVASLQCEIDASPLPFSWADVSEDMLWRTRLWHERLVQRAIEKLIESIPTYIREQCESIQSIRAICMERCGGPPTELPDAHTFITSYQLPPAPADIREREAMRISNNMDTR